MGDVVDPDWDVVNMFAAEYAATRGIAPRRSDERNPKNVVDNAGGIGASRKRRREDDGESEFPQQRLTRSRR